MNKIATLTLALGLTLTYNADAQNLSSAMAKKMMEKQQASAAANVALYKDKDMSSEMSAIKDGDSKFFVKVALNKNKVRMLGANSKKTTSLLRLKVNGYEIYKKSHELGGSLSALAKSPGYALFEVDLNGEGSKLTGFLASSSCELKEMNMEISVEPVKYSVAGGGSSKMDLSGGKSKFLGGAASANADYNFKYKDEFSDDKQKQIAIDYLNSRAGVTIGEFAWWHKEGESLENRVYYQKYLAKVTYKKKSGDTCYEATVEYWKKKAAGTSDWVLENATLQTGGAEPVPCAKAGL